jgi:glycosyltransferase involved in cell wall biosynthesis
MKLLVLEPDPSHGGGSEAVTLSLSRELAQRGHQVILLHETQGSMLPDYGEFAAEIVRRPLPGFALRAPWRTLACVARIGSLARRLGIDAVVSSHLGFIRHGALVRAVYGIPFLFHLGLPNVGSSRMPRMAYQRMGAGIAPSAHTRMDWAQAGWPAATLHEVRNWVDPQRFRPSADVAALRRELRMPEDTPCVVFVGRVCEQKGVDVLIQAFAQLGAGIDEANLVIVGAVAPDFRAPLEALLGLLDPLVRNRILLRPVTSFPEKYYAAADVACAPSRGDEAFGLTVLEAMSSGVPVVSSALGIIPQILGEEHGDLLVPAGDTASLAACLGFWLSRPAARIECGRRLRERVVQSYGPDPSIDAYEDVLAAMVRAARGTMVQSP